MGYNIETSDIDAMKKSLTKYIALEGISLHHEESNGFVRASYLFSNRWDYLATTCMDVYCFKDKPKDMAQCGNNDSE